MTSGTRPVTVLSMGILESRRTNSLLITSLDSSSTRQTAGVVHFKGYYSASGMHSDKSVRLSHVLAAYSPSQSCRSSLSFLGKCDRQSMIVRLVLNIISWHCPICSVPGEKPRNEKYRKWKENKFPRGRVKEAPGSESDGNAEVIYVGDQLEDT